jgi:hypothetical protein
LPLRRTVVEIVCLVEPATAAVRRVKKIRGEVAWLTEEEEEGSPSSLKFRRRRALILYIEVVRL